MCNTVGEPPEYATSGPILERKSKETKRRERLIRSMERPLTSPRASAKGDGDSGSLIGFFMKKASSKENIVSECTQSTEEVPVSRQLEMSEEREKKYIQKLLEVTAENFELKRKADVLDAIVGRMKGADPEVAMAVMGLPHREAYDAWRAKL